jgi:hypothetical protein
LLAAPLLAAALCASPARSAGPDRLELVYDISIAGFHVIDFGLVFTIDDSAYDVTTNLRTQGLFAWFMPWRQVSQSVGRVSDGWVRPERYEAIGTYRGDRREVRFRYRDGAIGGVELLPPLAEDNDREAVSEEEMGHALDPAAAIFAILRRATAGEPCTGTAPVFDGRRRMNFEFVDRGVERITAWRAGAYEGDARLCELTFRMVAGFMRGTGSEIDRQREPRRGRAWLAPVIPGKPFAPVRIEVDNSNWGKTVVRLRPIGAIVSCEAPASDSEMPAAPAQC